MRNDLMGWLTGAVDIEIPGRRGESFLNLAFRENILLTQVKMEREHIRARVALSDMGKLRDIARRSHCPFTIRRRVGLPFWAAAGRRRPLLPLMAALGIFLAVWISSFIFTLQVTGPYPLAEEDQARVLELAEEAGVAVGRSRWGLDMDAVKEHILREYPQLVFAQIEEKGVHLIIQVVKRVDVSADDAIKSPGDLIARCDGIVEAVLVRRGTAAVAQGDAVCAGDVLIYGYAGGEALAADGIVTARCWGEGYGECGTLMIEERPSGRRARSLGLRINNNGYWHLAGAAASPYAQYNSAETVYNKWSWRKTGLTVEILSIEYGEVLTISQEYSLEQARAVACAKAQQNAYRALVAAYGGDPHGSLQIVDQRVEELRLGDGPARAHAIAEGLAQIGVYRQNDAYLQGVPQERESTD